MRKLIAAIILFLLYIHSNAQGSRIHEDDDKSLDLSSLIQLAGIRLDSVDQILGKKDYKLSGSDTAKNEISYSYIKINTFVIKRAVTARNIKYRIEIYTDELEKKYAKQVADIKLQFAGTALINNGIETRYIYTNSSSDKWLISFSKISSAYNAKLALVISISPI